MDSSLDNSMLSRQPLATEPDEGEEQCMSGYEDDLCTQPVDPRPLAGLIVYVDVRSGTGSCQNHSEATAHQLETLGATVCPRFTKDVTHVVFKDGRPTTREKAEKKGLYLVSPLWVEACRRANDRVSEPKYPVLCREGSGTPVVLGKIKRIKSLQPKPLEEEVARSLERSRKRQRVGDVGSVQKVKKFVLLSEHQADNSDSDVELSNSSLQDSFELPAINLPGTPVAPGAVVNPENAVQRVATTPAEKSSPQNHETTPPIRSTECWSPVRKATAKEKKTGRKPKVSSVSTTATKLKPPKPALLKSLNKAAVRRKGGGKVTKPMREEKRENDENEATHDQQPVKQEDNGGCVKRKKKRVRFRGSPFGKQKPTLVLTSVQPKDQEIVFSIVEKLGVFNTSKTVCQSTTHLICGSPRRTINVLAATAKGCWVLSLDWVWKSLEVGRWVKEEPYEMTDHFPAAQFVRLERQQGGLLYRPTLFASAGPIFVASTTTPPPVQLELLLSLSGAKISGSQRKAAICVGCQSTRGEEAQSVTEQWILDSISEHQLLPLEDYLLDNPRSRVTSPEL